MQHEVSANLVGQLAYVGTKGTHLDRGARPEPASAAAAGTSTPSFPASPSRRVSATMARSGTTSRPRGSIRQRWVEPGRPHHQLSGHRTQLSGLDQHGRGLPPAIRGLWAAWAAIPYWASARTRRPAVSWAQQYHFGRQHRQLLLPRLAGNAARGHRAAHRRGRLHLQPLARRLLGPLQRQLHQLARHSEQPRQLRLRPAAYAQYQLHLRPSVAKAPQRLHRPGQQRAGPTRMRPASAPASSRPGRTCSITGNSPASPCFRRARPSVS